MVNKYRTTIKYRHKSEKIDSLEYLYKTITVSYIIWLNPYRFNKPDSYKCRIEYRYHLNGLYVCRNVDSEKYLMTENAIKPIVRKNKDLKGKRLEFKYQGMRLL